EKRAAIAKELASLLAASQPPAADVPDGKLFRQLTSLGGPLLSALPLSAATGSDAASTASGDLWGVDPARFGVAPDGSKVAKNGLILTAPALLEVRVPTDLVAGRQ